MMYNPPHPGEMLREDVLAELGLSVTEAAQRLGVARSTLSRVLHGHAGISPDFALRLEAAGVSKAQTWLEMQTRYDYWQVLQHPRPVVQPLDKTG